MLENIHCSVSALIRASTGLLREVKPFLVTCVSCDGPEPESEADLEWCWIFLDIDRSMIDLFVKVNPRWGRRRLRVRASLQQDSNWMAQVTTCIKYCLQWQDFSETRWAGIGPCSRKFVRSLVVGVEQPVKQAQANDAVVN